MIHEKFWLQAILTIFCMISIFVAGKGFYQVKEEFGSFDKFVLHARNMINMDSYDNFILVIFERRKFLKYPTRRIQECKLHRKSNGSKSQLSHTMWKKDSVKKLVLHDINL